MGHRGHASAEQCATIVRNCNIGWNLRKAGQNVPVRNRNGKLEWRFKVAGHEYSHITDLADTPRKRRFGVPKAFETATAA